MTLDDLEWPLPVLFHNVFVGAHHINLSEDHRHSPLLQADVYHSDSSFWQYKVFADIFMRVPWTGASNNSGTTENVNFWCFPTLYLRNLRK